MHIKILKMSWLPFFLPLHSHSSNCCLARHSHVDFPKQCSSHPPLFRYKKLAAQNSIFLPSPPRKLHTELFPTHLVSHLARYVPKVPWTPWLLLLWLPLSITWCIFIYFLLFRGVTQDLTQCRHCRSRIHAVYVGERHAPSLSLPSAQYPVRPQGCLVTGLQVTLHTEISIQPWLPPARKKYCTCNWNSQAIPSTNKESLNSREDGYFFFIL